MTAARHTQPAPSAAGSAMARPLSRHAGRQTPPKPQIAGAEPVEIPAAVAADAELSAAQAADVLNVSRPFLAKLLDEGEIPCRKTDGRRRIYVKDLVAYLGEIKRREALLSGLTAAAQDMGAGMGYGKG